MDATLLQLRHLLFGAEALPLGSDEQQAKALQLKCFLAATGVPESDRTYEAAEAMLDAGAQGRRDRLWATVTHASGMDKDYCLLAGSLAELDLAGSLLKGSPLADIADSTAVAREVAVKAHAAVLDYHSHQQQLAAQRAVGGGGAQQGHGFVTAGSGSAGTQPGPTGPGRPPFRPPVPGQQQQPAAGMGPVARAPLQQQQQPQQPDGGRWQTAGPATNGGAVLPGAGGGSTANGSGNGPSRWAAGKRGALEGGGAEDDGGGSGGGGGGGGGGGSGGAAGGGGGGMGGFRTAKSQLVADCARKGQPPPAFCNQAPRTGLMRPQKAQRTGGGGGGGGGGSSARGFVPPFVGKAVDAMGGGGGGEGEVESPYPVRLLEMLSDRNLLTYGPDGGVCLPDKLMQLEPKLVEHVFNEVMDRSSSIGWDDIAGQDAAKRLVQEMVVWPMLNPQLFTGARAPPRGLLLFGPPGTGKTLIGKAVAANINATFFSISASSLTSKWIGEGEKMVRALFALAFALQPSVIFIDEIDSLMSARKSEGEHEASRRMKTQMLIELDGCDPSADEKRILLVGATNRPEELDEAARRRMPKQLYIPLPCDAARHQMLTKAFRAGSDVAHSLSAADFSKVVERTAGYSGSDMKNLIQEACQGPVRDLFRSRGNVSNVQASELRPVCLRDFQLACKAQKRSVSDSEVERYTLYDLQFGAKYAEGEDGEGDGADDGW